MADDLKLLNQIIQHRLGQGDIDRILTQVSSSDRDNLMSKIGDLLHRMSALMDIYQELSGSPSLDVVLSRLIEIITEALTADRGTLFLYDHETGELFSRISQGEGISEIRIPAHTGIAGNVFTMGEAIIIEDAYADSRFNQEIDKKTGYRAVLSGINRLSSATVV